MGRGWRWPASSRRSRSSTRVGTDFLSTLTAMFNPLPAIALLPHGAVVWFGLGAKSHVFVIIHSVLWAGRAQHPFGLHLGQPYLANGGAELRTARDFTTWPCCWCRRAFPVDSLTGLKIGWAFALAYADCGPNSSSVSLRARAGSAGSSSRIAISSKSPRCFAGLLTVIVIGLVVESVIFRSIENVTIRRWGMQS